MYVVFSSNDAYTDTGYHAKIHVSEGNCSTPCSDFHPYCGFWESEGFCNHSYVAYMSANCKKSCNLCHSSSGCANLEYKGDNYCDDENNNANCDYDGGDCCGDNVDTSYCSQCQCLDPSHSTTTFQSTKQSSSYSSSASLKASSFRIVKPPFGPEQYQKKVHEKNSDEINEKSEKQMQGILKTSLSQKFKKTNSTSTLYIEPMLCPDYALIGNGICDQANDNLVCQYDGGDCCSLGGSATNCTSSECIDNLKFDPCPKFDRIGNDQCDKENFNLICSFDAGDCQAG